MNIINITNFFFQARTSNQSSGVVRAKRRFVILLPYSYSQVFVLRLLTHTLDYVMPSPLRLYSIMLEVPHFDDVRILVPQSSRM